MQPGQSTSRIQITRVEGGRAVARADTVVVEEPLEVRLAMPGAPDGLSIAVTMRTPGHDYELAAGLLFSEGVISGGEAIDAISYCAGPGEQEYNVLTVSLRPGVVPDLTRVARSFTATASCGLCGKTRIEEVRARIPPPSGRPSWRLDAATVMGLPGALREAQALFSRTGGLHAAALCRPDGSLITLREDVGRHNAVDKAIGERLLAQKVPLHDTVLVLSGRAGFELVQKAAVARIPAVVAVGAPSSLAVELAEEAGITLTGFTREGGFNIYSHGHRITV